MKRYDVIIIGAGASGLAAGNELSLAGKTVLIIEARNRIGGRIYSENDPSFSQTIEMGAEFIHGKLPHTLRLLEKAGIKHHEIKGKSYRIKNGHLEKTENFIEGWEELMIKLKEVKEDLTLSDFLDINFGDEKHLELRTSVIKYVEGYDAADAAKASTLSLRDEWENEDEHQERIDTEYGALVNYLADECKRLDGVIQVSKPVKEIKWQKDNVEVITTTNESFYGSKLLVTIPLGVWQADSKMEGHISYQPELVEKKAAAKKMGYGTVIKFLLQFKTAFWEDSIPNKMKNAGFIFSDAEIPTWWTQKPRETPMLTGWFAGTKAYALKDEDDASLIKKGIESLSYIFGVSRASILQNMKASKVINWTNETFSLGAYSYATLDTVWAKKALSVPIEHTLYFAGEALYQGSETGTVEGALANGIEVARQIIVDTASI